MQKIVEGVTQYRFVAHYRLTSGSRERRALWLPSAPLVRAALEASGLGIAPQSVRYGFCSGKLSGTRRST